VNEIQVESSGAMLVGSYSAAGSTVIIAVHGAGEDTRDWYLYRHLHDVLPPAGIGVVTFDRRGEGASTGQPSRGLFTVQADDALAVAGAIDAERVGLWGISQGGWVAPLAATRSDRVAFLVLLASTGVTPAEQMRYAVAEQIRRAGFGDAAAGRAVGLRKRAEVWIRGGPSDTLDADLAAAAASRGGSWPSFLARCHRRLKRTASDGRSPRRCSSSRSRSLLGCACQHSFSTATMTAGRLSDRVLRRGGVH
jgi:hypothetical protein